MSTSQDFLDARSRYKHALASEWASHPELMGKMFRPRQIDGNPFKNYVPISYSHTLLDTAGGVDELLRWWEVDTRT